jgi:hypothetical protein
VQPEGPPITNVEENRLMLGQLGDADAVKRVPELRVLEHILAETLDHLGCFQPPRTCREESPR